MNLLPKPSALSRCIGVTSQYLLAALFLFSGFVKAVDPIGTALKVSDYFTAFGLGGLRDFSLAASVLLISTEFVLGVLLLMGLFQRFTKWATLLLMSGMTLLTLYIFLFNPVSDCGCFGDFLKVSNSATFFKNLIFMVPTLFLFFEKRVWQPPFRNQSIQFALLALGLVGIAFFIQQNLRHLPLFDFRPFRVGTSLAELVLRPEGAEEDLYRYQFIYEKEGREELFDMENLPDSTWTYVDTKTTLIQKGYRPPVEDFALLQDFEDVTEDIVGSTNYDMIWVLAPRWENARSETAQAINHLYQYASQNGILFYGISGSDLENVANWKKETDAAYPFLLLDATTIRTIARANPSVIFLKKGVIHAKLNARDLHERSVALQAEQIFASQKPIPQSPLPRLLPLALWLFLTLIGRFTYKNASGKA